MMIIAGLINLIMVIPGVMWCFINGYDTMTAFPWLLFSTFLIVVGWELTNLKYWAWVCTIALIVIEIFILVSNMIIYECWQDIQGVAILTVVLVYFLAAKTRSQFT